MLAAAAAVMVVGFFVYDYRQVQGVREILSLTVVEFQDGSTVELVDGDGASPLSRNSVVRPGQGIRTDMGGHTTLKFADGTSLEVAADTQLQIVDTSRGRQNKLIRLESGLVAADVKPQAESSPLKMETRHAEVTVVGTTFALRADDARTVLRVHEGVVEFRRKGGQQVEGLRAGGVAVAGSDQPDTVADLVALYRFDAGHGDVVYDWSGFGEPLDLTIRDADAVRWYPDHLVTEKPTMIVSRGPASKVFEATRETGKSRSRHSSSRMRSPATGGSDHPNELSRFPAPHAM